MKDFVLRRLKAISLTIQRNNQLAGNELAGKSCYIAPQYSFEEVLRNNEKIVAALQDILLYEASGEAQPNPEYDEGRVDFCNKECTDFYREAYRNFGDSDTPHGIDGTITAHIKQIATELLQARNCIYRVHIAMYGIMGMQAGYTAATGKNQPQIFVDGMNKAFKLFEATRNAFTEAVNILCEITDFTPTEQTTSAIGGGNNGV